MIPKDVNYVPTFHLFLSCDYKLFSVHHCNIGVTIYHHIANFTSNMLTIIISLSDVIRRVKAKVERFLSYKNYSRTKYIHAIDADPQNSMNVSKKDLTIHYM